MEEDHTAKLDIFWRYFRKTWMKYRPTIRTQVTITLTILIYIYSLIQYTLIYTLILALIHTGTGVYLTSSWNIYHLIQEDGSLMETEDGLDVMINRTNNPLERFNKNLKEKIPTHPSMQVLLLLLLLLLLLATVASRRFCSKV